MTENEFAERLAAGGIVPLSRHEWEELAPHFPVEERHQTQLAGELLIVRVGEELAAVEAPSRDARVGRLLGSREAVRKFVDNRMEEYERMWDGCGVRVDYYEETKE